MSENYIVINGKKAELTAEQLKALGIEDKIKSPFARECGKEYCFINDKGEIKSDIETSHVLDQLRHSVANYCTDQELMQQRALHETLNRLLWRYACENGELENEWDGCDAHYYIWRHAATKNFLINSTTSEKKGLVYFPTREVAEKAMRDIIKPFMVAHPDFVW